MGPTLYIAAGALAVGSFLPWVSATAPFVGTISFSGMEGDGVFTLIAAGLIFVAASQAASGGKPQWAWIIVGLLGALLIYEFSNVSEAISEGAEYYTLVSYGTGLWVCAAGAVAAMVGLAQQPRGSLSSSPVSPPPPS